ncbi:MAG: hypothetical protein WBN96_14740 [Gammaproteobacteria bacterium]
MIKVYSKRLLQPYVGVVQVAEMGWARALSLDGKNWAIRYAQDESRKSLNEPFSHDPRVNPAFIVTIEGDQHKTRVIRSSLEPERVRSDSQRLFDAISITPVPFEAADRFEYWLLDGSDESPLALLHSCVYEEDMRRPVPPPEWLSIPAAQLAVPDPDSEAQATYLPPVNYRLQQLIENRAGNKPRGAWFERLEPTADDFPPCLIRDVWEDPECQRLCDLYLQRLAPRLLMMDGLPLTVRQRLEQSACDYVFDIEKFYPLYPEVVDNSRLNTARVEARLRRANEA